MRKQNRAEGRPGSARGLLLGALGLAALAGGACQSQPPPREPDQRGASFPEAPVGLPSGTGSARLPGVPPPEQEPLLVVSDPAALDHLEARGFDFRSFALGLAGGAEDSAAGYLEARRYRDLVETLERDLVAAKAADRRSGVGLEFAHRLFDKRWLRSPHFRFRLIGVVNRADRRVFQPEFCGELRFIYRLEYQVDLEGELVSSRLPMTLNVVRWLRPLQADCQAQIERWQRGSEEGAALAEKLVSALGPLGAQALKSTSLKSVEVDLQSARWPATVRPNMTGHAEYLLRVFTEASGRWLPAALENTPDVERIERRPELRRQLISWLARPATLRAVDQGTVVVPERFLATRALSVAPHGLARRANRPYQQLLAADDMSELDFTSYSTFSSFEEYVRRLDGLSCMGCHQSRSLAGFHFLGEDAETRRVDALALPFSPHFVAELSRRRRYLESLLAGQSPDERRLPAERMGGGAYGAHCGLGAAFAGWTCDAGLGCVRLHDAAVGQCMPRASQVGDVCEQGTIQADDNPHRDYVRLARASGCGAGQHCEKSGVGFPGGMCSGSCSGLGAEATCGGIALLTEFNACLARQTPFETCVREQTRPGALRRCSGAAPCRDDYVCARMPDGQGACIPPYFLFQLRVDGHVL